MRPDGGALGRPYPRAVKTKWPTCDGDVEDPPRRGGLSLPLPSLTLPRMDPTESPATLGLLVSLVLVATWIFAMWIASRASGWHRAARRFGNPGPFASVGNGVRFASAQIGWGNYSGALDLRVSPSGLYLAPIPFFRAFHPPLFIPWNEIEVPPSPRPKSAPRLTVRAVPGFQIRFSGRALALVRPYLAL